jgi:hypothetical protein
VEFVCQPRREQRLPGMATKLERLASNQEPPTCIYPRTPRTPCPHRHKRPEGSTIPSAVQWLYQNCIARASSVWIPRALRAKRLDALIPYSSPDSSVCTRLRRQHSRVSECDWRSSSIQRLGPVQSIFERISATNPRDIRSNPGCCLPYPILKSLCSSLWCKHLGSYRRRLQL